MIDVETLAPRLLALGDRMRVHGKRLASAESCTGGLVAALCTSVAGSSDWFERGFVTYSNAAKTEMLGVPASAIARHGAVSQEVVQAMAAGALIHSAADLAVAVTGIAGPGGAVPGKPVGMVWLAIARRGAMPRAWCEHFAGDRTAVRAATVEAALAALERELS